MTGGPIDPFRFDDAAYVLGALDDTQRRAFEEHLTTCADCRARVADVRPAVDLLAGLTVLDIVDPEPVPDTLLPGLLRAAHRERARRAWFARGVGVVAAACAIALAVVLWPSGSSTPARQPFVAVRPSPVTATAQLVSRAWGTEIELHCKYATQLDGYLPYRLRIVDDANHVIDAGSWRLAPGGETDFTTGTEVPRSKINRLEITTDSGTPILVLRA